MATKHRTRLLQLVDVKHAFPEPDLLHTFIERYIGLRSHFITTRVGLQTNDNHQTLIDVNRQVLDLHQRDGHFVDVDLRATS